MTDEREPLVPTLLPMGLTLDYLRCIANVGAEWCISVVFDHGIDLAVAACLDAQPENAQATIRINARYLFSARALARAIGHELLELASFDTWRIFILSARGQTDLVQQYRRARDLEIERRLNALPFWGPYDVPIMHIQS